MLFHMFPCPTITYGKGSIIFFFKVQPLSKPTGAPITPTLYSLTPDFLWGFFKIISCQKCPETNVKFQFMNISPKYQPQITFT